MIRSMGLSVFATVLMCACQGTSPKESKSALSVTPGYELLYPNSLILIVDSGHADMTRFIFRHEASATDILVEAGPYCSNLAAQDVEPVLDSTYFEDVIGRLPAEERERYAYVGHHTFDPDSLKRDNVYWGRHAGLSFKKLVPRKSEGRAFYGYHFYCLQRIGAIKACFRLNVYTPAGDSTTFALVDSLAMSLKPR